MIDILGLFFLDHFDASIYWWVLFLIVFLAEVYVKGKRQEKLDEFLNNAKKEFELRELEREAKEPHIYLGGMLDD